MTYEIDRSHYTQNTITNTETGVTLTQWEDVTVGKSKNVWQIEEIFSDGKGGVRLHRQVNGRVLSRRESMDRLSKVEAPEAVEVPVEEEAPLVRKFKAGDWFHVGTSDQLYTVTHDETKTGIVRAVSGGRRYRWNSNHDALNLWVPEPRTPEEAPTAPETAPEVARVVEAMKAEINGLIAGGVVPEDVPDFPALHDFVDANMLAYSVYGSEIPEDETDEQGEARMDRETPIFNKASTAVDAWLKAGRPVDEGTATPCTAPGLACENPDHDHFTNDPDDAKTADGGRLCNDCGAPCHWDEGLEDYRHDSADTPPCFLIPA